MTDAVRAVAQPGIFAQGTRAHYYLEFDVRPGADDGAVVAALTRLREPAVTAGGANIVIALGPDLWRRLSPGEAPASLQPFVPIGPSPSGTSAPATQHDVWLWFHGTNHDVVLDMARAATVALGPVADLATEQPAFVYLDSRDMTGFIDGTENPPIWDAPEVAIVRDGPGAGGSFVLVMKWVHDLGRFHALPEEEQEGVIGRTKADSVELDDDVKPPTAHIARVVIEDDDGHEREIFRRSTPFGSVHEQGLQFVAFSHEPEIFTIMLRRMLLADDGLHDRLTDFSTPVSGSFYFAPSIEALLTTCPSSG